MKLYELEQQQDGSVKVETELTPEDMKILLTIGLMGCLQQGVMVASLIHHYKQPEDSVGIDYNKVLDGEFNA